MTRKNILLITICFIAFIALCTLGFVMALSSPKNEPPSSSPPLQTAAPQTSPSKNTNLLQIEPGWKWETGNSGDTCIQGNVKNISTQRIFHFKVTAEYLDSNDQVLATSFTNISGTIAPGNQKRFEIVHKDNKAFKKLRLSISDVLAD